MAGLPKASILAALICPLALAAECAFAGACLDETSLVQMQQIVKHGSERIPIVGNDELLQSYDTAEYIPGPGADFIPPMLQDDPTPVTHNKAVADAEPGMKLDRGTVASAFASNERKANKAIMDKTNSDMDFNDQVREERNYNRQMAEAAVEFEQKKTKKELEADSTAVKEATAKRKKTVTEAIHKVEKAKERELAHSIKVQQVQSAALAGRAMGTAEGMAKASHMNEVYKKKVAAEEEIRKQKQEIEASKHRIEEARKVIESETEKLTDKDKYFEDNAREKARAERAAVAAHAAESMEAIEGADGVKNILEDRAADQVAKHFEWMTKQEQENIDEAVSANLLYEDFGR